MTQSNSVIQVASLSIDVGGNVTLNAAANDFGTISTLKAKNVSITDANGAVLGNVDLKGKLTLRTSGDITQASGGVLVVADNVDLDAGTGSITLTNSGNLLGGVRGGSGNLHRGYEWSFRLNAA